MKIFLRCFGVALLLLLIAVGTFYARPFWALDGLIRLHLWQQHVQSRYVPVDGYRIHYFEAAPRDQAQGADRALILVHGLGSRGEDWSGMIAALAAQGFHVYALDLLGYGRSSKPDVDYSISLEEKTVVNFMQALHLQRADLGGWSMGGWVVLKLAADHPELVDRMVVYDAAGLYFLAPFEPSLFTPKDEAGLARLSARLTPHPKTLPRFIAKAAVARLQANAWVINRSLHAMTGGRDLLDFRLGEIRAPTLIVWGKQDTLIPLSSGETMHRDIAGSSLLVVDGCGHLAPAECTKPVLAGTLAFLHAEKAPTATESTVAGR